jgi:predicted metal-dependent peptidase
MSEQPTRPRVIVVVAFSGNDEDLNVDRAALELEQCGYEVTRLPDELAARQTHPLDDVLEALIDVDGSVDGKVLDAIMQEVYDIVDQYGGDVIKWGLLREGHVPFAEAFNLGGRSTWGRRN